MLLVNLVSLSLGIQIAQWNAVFLAICGQWGIVIGLHYVFVRQLGYEPRDVYLRSFNDVPNSVPDRVYSLLGFALLIGWTMVVLIFALPTS